MLRFIFLALLILSCSHKTTKTGGERSYAYDPKKEYSTQELKELSSEVIVTLRRDPHVGKLDQLFSKNQNPLKRIGILIFETQIQPTLDGLAGHDQIYLSESGKQILTENLLSIWEESFKILIPEIDYVPTAVIKKSTTYNQFGILEDIFVKTPRSSLASDDIFFVEKGKKTTTTTTLNPRGMRDVSLLLVPAYELMAGPKWSEHGKHFVNDVAKELNLDAVFIVMSKISWTAAHTDKRSGEIIPEEATLEIKTSTLIPLSRYHERLEKLRINQKPSLTLAYRTHETKLKVPVLLSVPENLKTFDTIDREILSPVLKTYKDLSQMMILEISEDLKKTW